MLSYLKNDINRYSYGMDVSLAKLFLISMSKLGFWAVLNYRIGYYLRDKFSDVFLVSYFVKVLTCISKLIIEILTGVSISYHAHIGEGLLIAHFSNIIVGDGVHIGKGATLHQGVTIGVSGRGEKRGVPVIGNNFFSGANAVIAGKIIVGDNVSVSANSFVFCDVSDFSVVSSSTLNVISKNGESDA